MKKKAIILVMVIGIVLGLLWGSKNVLGQPVSLYVYAVRDVDYVLKDGTVYKCDIFFEKADYMTNSLGRDYYDESIHTNQWYKDAKVIYCLEINGAYPYGWYNSNTSSLTESQLVNKEGYANLVRNASYRDYWSQNNVQNLGAQIQAAQIAVWILTNDSSMSNRFPTDPKKWTGNLDKYTYEEVGGMSDMIATLIECYNNPELNIVNPNISIEKSHNLEDGFHNIIYDVSFENLLDRIDINLEFSQEGVLSGLPLGVKVLVDGVESQTIEHTYELKKGSKRIVVKVPDALEYDNMNVDIIANSVVLDSGVDNILYYWSNQKKDKFQNGVYYRVQSMMGATITARKPGVSAMQQSNIRVSLGDLKIYKKGNVLVSFVDKEFVYEDRLVTGAVFGLYKDFDCKEKIAELVTNEGVAYIDKLPQGTYYVKEITPLVGCVLDTKVYKVDINSKDNQLHQEINLYNNSQQGYIQMIKKDSTDNIGLQGAVFGIYATTDIYDYSGKNVLIKNNELISTITSDKEGKAEFLLKLPVGYEYRIREIKAPFGYVQEDKEIFVDVEWDPNKGMELRYEKEVTNSPQKGVLSIGKLNEDQPLEGARFGIYKDKACKEFISEVITNDQGQAYSDSLPLGEYFVKELKAPKGYVLEEKVYSVKLEYDEQLVKVHKGIKISNKPTKIQISKLDSTGIQEYLSGATLCIKDMEGNIVHTFVTKNEPEIIQNIPVGTYYLEELEAPEGFRVANQTIIEVKNTSQLQCFQMVDEPVLGSIDFKYNPDAHIVGVPEVGPDEVIEVPYTGDNSNIIAYIILLISALMIMLRGKKIRGLLVLVMILLTPTTVLANEEYVVESEVIYDEEVPEYAKVVQYEGEEYALKDVKVEVISKVANRVQPVTHKLKFSGYDELDWKNTSYVGQVYDPVVNNIKKSVLLPTECELIRNYWSDDFEFDIEVEIIGPYILVEDEIIVYNYDNPGLYEFRAYMIDTLGLDSTKYIIDSIEWKTEELYSNDKKIRIATAKGRRLLKDYLVTYEGEIVLDDIPEGKRYVAVYYKVAPQKEEIIETIEEVKENVEKTSSQQKNIEDNIPKDKETDKNFYKIFGIIIGIMAAIVIVITALVWYNRDKKFKGTKKRKNKP